LTLDESATPGGGNDLPHGAATAALACRRSNSNAAAAAHIVHNFVHAWDQAGFVPCRCRTAIDILRQPFVN
jgi:hypothetical protein